MRTYLMAVAAVVSLAALAGRAEARHVRFTGPHPIAARFGGGFCYIETPHLHPYPPDHGALFQQVGDEYVFTGDPTPFGYEGDKHTFYGHHPIMTVSGEPVYCYLNGPHSHPFPPPDGPDYKVKGNVAFYTGPFAPSYLKQKPHREKLVNAEYRPYGGFRPTVEVEPPPEYHGEVYVQGPNVEIGAPGVVVGAPGVVVNAPGVYVEPPAPRVVVEPPGPRVVVHAPGVFVEPPAPRVVVHAPGVFVAPPGPRVVVGAPGVVVGGEVRVHERHERWHEERHEEHGHHDNGEHKGWYK